MNQVTKYRLLLQWILFQYFIVYTGYYNCFHIKQHLVCPDSSLFLFLEYSRLFHLEVTCSDHLIQLPEHFRADQVKSMLLQALSKYLLNTVRFLTPITSLRRLLRDLTTPLVKKYFLMPSLDLSWCSFEPFHVSDHWVPGNRDQRLSLHCLVRKL